jgi:hypothetical protein
MFTLLFFILIILTVHLHVYYLLKLLRLLLGLLFERHPSIEIFIQVLPQFTFLRVTFLFAQVGCTVAHH